MKRVKLVKLVKRRQRFVNRRLLFDRVQGWRGCACDATPIALPPRIPEREKERERAKEREREKEKERQVVNACFKIHVMHPLLS